MADRDSPYPTPICTILWHPTAACDTSSYSLYFCNFLAALHGSRHLLSFPSFLPLSGSSRQLATAPPFCPIFDILLHLTTAPPLLFISAIFRQLSAACDSPSPPIIYAIFLQLMTFHDNPTTYPNLCHFATASGSSSPSFIPFFRQLTTTLVSPYLSFPPFQIIYISSRRLATAPFLPSFLPFFLIPHFPILDTL